MIQKSLIFKLFSLLALLCINSFIFAQTLKIKNETILKSTIELNKTFLFIYNENISVLAERLSDKTLRLSIENLLTHEQVTINEINTSSPVIAKVSSNGRYVTYSYENILTNRWVSKVYQIKTGRIVTLEHPEGGISYPSISPTTGEILYQLRITGEVPQLWICREDGTDGRIVAFGIGGVWSPNGKWFLFKPLTEENISLKEKYHAGKITKEEFQKQAKQRNKQPIFWPLTLYTSTGEKVITLKEFTNASDFQWSPDGYKIALRNSGEGLFIVELNFDKSKKEDYKSTFISEIGYDPSWSLNSRYLAYETSEEDETHHYIVNKDIYIVKSDGSERLNLTNTPTILESTPVWTAEGNLIFIRGDETKDIVKLELETR